LYIGNVMLVVLNLPLIPLWVRVLKIPANLLSVLILIFCFLGSYSINGSLTDVVITFAFGVIGVVLRRLRFETPPLILALVLGPLIEVNFRQTMISYDANLWVFAQRPICAVLLLVALGIVVTALFRRRRFSAAIAGEE
ncbi:MAG: tripartite tricarboxylate transporter permease, partial [Burkholderiales bacterium]|nr:tripartite tricarboxylate transporter permease [Burkholderiales bacterium]